jgi:hypothetical protein
MARELLSTEQILCILRETPDRLGRVTDGLTDAQLHARPVPGEWSVAEILAHLRSCADVWGKAIEMITSTDHPTIRAVSPRTWINRTDYADVPFVSSLQAFARQRAGLLADGLADEAWSRSGTVLGGGRPVELSVHSYASRLARHERTHWRQVDKTVGAFDLRPSRRA